MQLGRHLRELWEHRAGLAIALAISLLAALWSVERISLLPPGISPRGLQMSSATTRVLVDTPKSTVLDLQMDTYNFVAITNRALLVGNVMASPPVKGYIARRAHVPVAALQVASPVTVEFPRPLASSGEKHTSDILKSPEQYRLSIQANPTAPVVDIYAQAPTPDGATRLADGAVKGMQDYLAALGAQQGIPAKQQVRLEQLGGARGVALNSGVRMKVAILTFVLVFVAACATVLFLTRVRRGWTAEGRELGEARLRLGSPETRGTDPVA